MSASASASVMEDTKLNLLYTRLLSECAAKAIRFRRRLFL